MLSAMSVSACALVAATVASATNPTPPHPDAASACASFNTSMLISVMHGEFYSCEHAAFFASAPGVAWNRARNLALVLRRDRGTPELRAHLYHASTALPAKSIALKKTCT